MESSVFRTAVLLFLAILILPLILVTSSEAGGRASVPRGFNPLEVAIYLPGSRSIQFSPVSYSLADGIEVMGSYRPARFFHLAGVFTHYADAEIGSHQEEKSKFGAGVFIATPWGRLYPRARRLGFVHYRAKITGIYDLTGIKINTGSEGSSLGRFRESRIVVGAEFGAKTGTGMIFMGFSWFRSINYFSGGSIDVGSNNHFVFNVGISLL